MRIKRKMLEEALDVVRQQCADRCQNLAEQLQQERRLRERLAQLAEDYDASHRAMFERIASIETPPGADPPGMFAKPRVPPTWISNSAEALAVLLGVEMMSAPEHVKARAAALLKDIRTAAQLMHSHAAGVDGVRTDLEALERRVCGLEEGRLRGCGCKWPENGEACVCLEGCKVADCHPHLQPGSVAFGGPGRPACGYAMKLNGDSLLCQLPPGHHDGAHEESS